MGQLFFEMYQNDPEKTAKILVDAYKEELERIRKFDVKVKQQDEFDEIIKDILPPDEPFSSLAKATMKGEVDTVVLMVKSALENKYPALDIVTKSLVPGIQAAAALYDQNWFYAPDLLMAGSAVQTATPIAMAKVENVERKGLIIMHAPKGDVHDIGKNIVKIILESSFFEAIDLGVDVPAEKVVATAKERQPILIVGSALMTTTMGALVDTGKALQEAGLSIPFAVGGAPLTQKYTENIPLGIYGEGPKDAVEIADLAASGLSWQEIKAKKYVGK